MTAAVAAPESAEDADLRRTVADIARRCRAARAADGDDHGSCWQTLQRAGLTELRHGDDDGQPLATTGQVAIVVEEMAGAVCGAPLVGALLASELVRLSGASLGDETVATVLLSPDLQTWSAADDAVAWDAAAPVDHAVGLDGDAVVLRHVADATPTQDLSRPLARPAGHRVEIGTLTPEQRSDLDAFARIVLAADLLGACAAVLREAVEYAGHRVQFGQAIGTFQAVQHLCARAHVKVEAQRSALLFAAWSHDSGGVDAFAPVVAKAYADRAAVEVVEAAVQVFGGVAITWEFSAHRHLRRVLLDAEVLGRADVLAEQLLTLVEGASHGLQ